MIDLRKVNIEKLKISTKKRGHNINIDEVFILYNNLKEEKKLLDELISRQKKTENKEEALEIKNLIKEKEFNVEKIQQNYEEMLFKVPNILEDDVPYGKNDEENVPIEQNGEIIFYDKHHYDMDIFFPSNDIFGSRFVVLKGEFAKLERALANFMLEKLQKNSFQEYSFPYILKNEAFFRSCHFPKDKENMFCGDDWALIPTGEAPLVNLVYKKRFPVEELPIYMCTLTDCFRKEAGSAGKDTKGLIRVHQFKKCEMVAIAHHSKSREAFHFMLRTAKEILEDLEIPYRVVNVCSGDIGFNGTIQYDIEIPVGGKWREVSSVSDCGHIQSTRLQCRDSDGNWVHLLNGSGLAVGRTLSSLLEINYLDNGIKIPKKLQNFMNKDFIKF